MIVTRDGCDGDDSVRGDELGDVGEGLSEFVAYGGEIEDGVTNVGGAVDEEAVLAGIDPFAVVGLGVGEKRACCNDEEGTGYSGGGDHIMCEFAL